MRQRDACPPPQGAGGFRSTRTVSRLAELERPRCCEATPLDRTTHSARTSSPVVTAQLRQQQVGRQVLAEICLRRYHHGCGSSRPHSLGNPGKNIGHVLEEARHHPQHPARLVARCPAAVHRGKELAQGRQLKGVLVPRRRLQMRPQQLLAHLAQPSGIRHESAQGKLKLVDGRVVIPVRVRGAEYHGAARLTGRPPPPGIRPHHRRRRPRVRRHHHGTRREACLRAPQARSAARRPFRRGQCVLKICGYDPDPPTDTGNYVRHAHLLALLARTARPGGAARQAPSQ